MINKSKRDSMRDLARLALASGASMLGLLCGIAIGFVSIEFADAICPEEKRVSGLCVAWWYEILMDQLLAITAAFSAFLIVLFPAFAYPSERRAVSSFFYMIGGVFAILLALGAAHFAWWELVCALGAGGLALWLVFRSGPQRLGCAERGN